MSEQTVNDIQYVRQLRDHMYMHRFMLSYRGVISQDLTKALLEMAEKEMILTGTDLNIKKKVFNVMVECLQNLTKYNYSEQEDTSSLFMIGKSENGYIIYSGNTVLREKALELKSKLEKISAMSRVEIKEFYKSVIKSREFSKEQGAGLGLIDIAKKTGNSLDYDFSPIDDKRYYFSLRTFIKRNN